MTKEELAKIEEARLLLRQESKREIYKLDQTVFWFMEDVLLKAIALIKRNIEEKKV